MLQRTGHQGERRPEVVAHLSEEAQLGGGAFLHFLFELPGAYVAPVGLGGNEDHQKGKGNHQPHNDALGVVFHQKGVQPGVDVLHMGPLIGHFRFLHLEDAGVAAVYQGAFQQVLPLEGRSAKNIQGQFHHQVAAGGVQVGGGELSVNHFLQAGFRQGIHPEEGYIGRVAQRFPGTPRHAVVLAKDGVGPDTAGHHFFHGIVAAFLEPASVRRHGERNARIFLQGLCKAFVAVIGRGGTLQARDFHHLAFLAQEIGHIVPHDAANFHIVGTNEGGVFVRVDFPVEQNDRNAGVKSFLHGRRNSVRLIGRDNQQVHAIGHKTADLGHLLLAVVIGR